MKCSLLALTRHLDHELDVNGSAEVEAHLVGCNRCTNALAQLKEDKVALGELHRIHVDRQSLDGLLAQIGVELASETGLGALETVDETTPVAVMEAVQPPTEIPFTDEMSEEPEPEEKEATATGVPSWSGAGLGVLDSEPEVELESAAQSPPPNTDLPFLAGRGPARAPELSPWQRFTDWASLLVKGGRGQHGAIESVAIVKGNRPPTYLLNTEPGLDDGVDFPGIAEPVAFNQVTKPTAIVKTEEDEKPVVPVPLPVISEEPPAPRVFPEIEALREELRDKTPPPTRAVGEPKEPSRKNQRLAIFAGVVLLLMLIGLGTGKWISNKPLASTSASASQSIAHTATPTASVSANATPTAATPTSASQGFVPSQTVGNGGTGYQIQDLRYGNHPNDFRIVFDLVPAGSASGDPTAIVGFVNGSTLQVRILSTVPAGSAGDPGNSVVTSASLVQPPPVSGAAVYNFTLSQGVTPTLSYLSSPERLVLDLTY